MLLTTVTVYVVAAIVVTDSLNVQNITVPRTHHVIVYRLITKLLLGQNYMIMSCSYLMNESSYLVFGVLLLESNQSSAILVKLERSCI